MEVKDNLKQSEQTADVKILDVAIVGAGISGLVAAKIISEKQCGISMKIFEKTNHPGGQLGGLKSRWITSDHYHAAMLCRELRIPLSPMKNLARSLHASPVGRIDIGPFDCNNSECHGFIPSLHRILARIESTRFLAKLDYLSSQQKITWNPSNMDEYLCHMLLFKKSRHFYRFLIKIGTGFYPAELTVSECLQLIRSMSSLRHLYEMFTLQEDHLYPTGFPNWEILVERLLAKINHGTINYSTNIVKVELPADGQDRVVSLYDTSGRCWRARYVILAMSCSDLIRIDMQPAQPHYFTEPNSLLGIWCVTTFTLLYPAPSWHDHGYTGSLFLPDRNLICYQSGPAQLSGSFFSPLRGQIDDTERHRIREQILRLLENNFRCRTLLKPLECHLEINPIPFYFDVYPTFARCLIFGSTNVSCWYRGFINGSVQGGIRAATLALQELRPQTITFEDVTDMQCIHFKYFKRPSVWINLWYSLNLASGARFVLRSGVLLLTIAIFRSLFNLCNDFPELTGGRRY